MKLLNKITDFGHSLTKFQSIPLLLLRLVLAYGFFVPAKMKWGNIDGIAQWFESLGYPLPTLNAYVAATTETLGVVLLTLGFATRLISIPLMFVMVIAILTVHMGNGFDAGDNGFEIPLYYLLMLFTLFISGPGKYSIDSLLSKKA